MTDLADELARQARALFGHLPPGEIGDDEQLLFKTDRAGRLLLWVPERAIFYTLRHDMAWRWKVRRDGGADLASFENGEPAREQRIEAERIV
jgi:hypothetical protein